MTLNSKNLVNLNVIYSLEKEIAKYVDCKWAGKGWENYRSKESIDETIKRLYGNDPPDWIIYNRSDLEEFEKISQNKKERNFRLAMTLTDLHVNPIEWIKAANTAFDLTYMRYLYSPYVEKSFFNLFHYYSKFNPYYYQEKLKTRINHFPWFTDPKIYKPSYEKIYDVIFLGSYRKAVYPLRYELVKNIPSLCKKNKWNYLIRGRPPGSTVQRNINELKKRGYIVGRDYANTIAKSNVFIFGNSIFNYPVSKYFEIMGSGTLVMANKPQTEKELHLKSGENYVEINMRNWKEKLEYYLQDDAERERIAKNGHETAIRNHSVKVRAKQQIETLNQ